MSNRLFELEQEIARVKQVAIAKSLSKFSRAKDVEPSIFQNAVYLPLQDKELKEVAKNAIYSLPNMHPKILTGQPNPLANLSPNVKLYLILHGHAKLPRFVVHGDNYNPISFAPAKLAEWMERDGLRKDHRELELLVCHAGESVGTREIVKKREAIQEKYHKVNASKKTEKQKEKLQKKLKTKFNKVGIEPSEFTKSDQWLPLAAEFVDELKKRKYTNIRVIAYKGPVSQSFGENSPHDYPITYGQDRQQGKQWGEGKVWVKIDKEYKPGKDYQVIWTPKLMSNLGLNTK